MQVADEYLQQLLSEVASKHAEETPTSMLHLLRKGGYQIKGQMKLIVATSLASNSLIVGAMVDGSLSAGELWSQLPWFERYRQEFFRMLAFSEHECYDHPIACEISD